MNAGYLPVSGPLDFRLVIQVLLSPYVLKCMRTQTVPPFNVPRGRRGTTTRVVPISTPAHIVPGLVFEPGTFGVGGESSTTELHPL